MRVRTRLQYGFDANSTDNCSMESAGIITVVVGRQQHHHRVRAPSTGASLSVALYHSRTAS